MNELVLAHTDEYHKATKSGKTVILDSLVSTTGANRKSIIRAFASKYKAKRPIKKRGRPRRFTGEVNAALKTIWDIYNHPCGERLHVAMPEAVRILKRDGMWLYNSTVTELLLSMSLATIKRRVNRLAHEAGLARGISTTNSAESVKKLVPVFYGNYATKGLGYGEIDTVVHSGPKLMGVMAYSLTFVDMETYWVEPIAQYDKTAEVTMRSLQLVRQRLPWRLKGIHPDSGSEFINYQLHGYCKKHHIELARSRPYKKNDNCHVEERNRHVIREYTGYSRYDHPEVVVVLNELYEAVRLYINFFQPVFKVTRKEVYVNENGMQVKKKTKKTYSLKTPYQRALECPLVDKHVKQKLTKQYELLNPKLLSDRIDLLQRKVNKLQKQLGYNFELDNDSVR